MKTFNSFAFSTLLIAALLSASAHAATFDIRNNCPYTVWAAAVPGGGQRLDNGQTWTINVAAGTTGGRVWGRTNCNFDGSGHGSCQTGDCGGLLQCTAYGAPPNTLAEFALNQFSNLDFFDISLVDGFNVPMDFSPTSNGCTRGISCTADINARRIYRIPIDLLEEKTTGIADLILVNSKFTASTFARTFKGLNAFGIRPAVLYPAVNLDQFKEPNAIKLNFLSINRFERKKNIELAISAFAMLQNLACDELQGAILDGASLTIAGGYDKRLRENVDYLEELKDLAQREGISDRVNFITSCSTSERNALLSECLCVLYTPKDEHFGIVPLEAMASCKPVIACNSGGPVETIKNGVTGFLCDPSPRDFSLAMAKLIQKPEMAEGMGREARLHIAQSFSTKTFGNHLDQYLVDVARGKKE